jgi:catalase
MEMHGLSSYCEPEHHPEDNDLGRAGNLYHLMSEPEEQRLIENISGSLSLVSREHVVQ